MKRIGKIQKTLALLFVLALIVGIIPTSHIKADEMNALKVKYSYINNKTGFKIKVQKLKGISEVSLYISCTGNDYKDYESRMQYIYKIKLDKNRSYEVKGLSKGTYSVTVAVSLNSGDYLSSSKEKK